MSDADRIRLEADGTAVEIALVGAEMTSWMVDGRQLLWQANPAIWAATSPLLFPVVGWCRNRQIRVEGVSYPMPVHGFAASERFAVESCEDREAVLLLRDNAKTQRCYPFAFTLRVHYSVAAGRVSIRMAVTNEDSCEIFYSCGIHPGFAMPFAGGALEDYRVLLERAEEPRVPVIVEGGLFSDERRSIPLFGRTLALNDQVFAQEAMCFLHADSKWLALERPGHGRISVAADNFPHFAIWSRPGAPFVSLEAWTGHGDPVAFDGEFAEKPGLTVLPPGGVGTAAATLSFAPG